METAELIAFEAEIAEQFNRGAIRAPIHLSGGNEQQLIDIFKDVRPGDWCFSTWRSHYHALLHGVPPEKVRAEILAGRSISLQFPEHRFYSSAIVGGHLPIAVGVALAIKRAGGSERVWCFLGDMAAHSGIFHECSEYAWGHGLPITFVIEENGLSVCTPTEPVWGSGDAIHELAVVREYEYTLPWPHSGAGRRIEF